MSGPCEFVLKRDKHRSSQRICAKPGKRAGGRFLCVRHFPAVVS